MCKKSVLQLALTICLFTTVILSFNGFSQSDFKGRYFSGSGDSAYLELLDKAYQAFVTNSQALWFRMIGDGERTDHNGYVAPVGSLCDAARPGTVWYKQGDGKHKIHDWGFGFTAAGIILQAELFLIKRDREEIREYLPLLELCADFIDSRRDPVKNIFLIGVAGNLLAPSYAGSGKQLADGTCEMAYLAEISVNYIAALDRLIELEKMLNRKKQMKLYQIRREKVKTGLNYFLTDEGHFIRALEQNGTQHGHYGAPEYGYFDATPNHDAMAFRVIDDEQALKIYNKINSLPGLRPHKLILPNYPSYNDMYEDKGLFKYGRWLNGGHWTTCEARMILGYYRVNAFNDAKDAFQKILDLSLLFKLDNPLTNFGANLYQPKLPVNCVYNAWGVSGGFLRGLFEYEYKADGMSIYLHIPEGIIQLKQKSPVYFGEKKIYIMTNGAGSITSVLVNGKIIKDFDPKSTFLEMKAESGVVFVSFGLGNLPAKSDFTVIEKKFQIPNDEEFWNIYKLMNEKKPSSPDEVKNELALRKIRSFYTKLDKEKLSDTYEYKHAESILECIRSIYERRKLKQTNNLVTLAQVSQTASDELYISTVKNLYLGLTNHLEKNRASPSEQDQQIAKIWFEKI